LEFREFVLRGNVLNLAVGVIIGAAFQSIVTSLTNDILSPILGLFTGNNFDELKINLIENSIRYGAFLTNIINFIIMSFIVFLIVKFVNRIMSIHKKPSSPSVRECPYCFSKIDIRATKCSACASDVPAGMGDEGLPAAE
jgi:large conductance mechanosensitive channel